MVYILTLITNYFGTFPSLWEPFQVHKLQSVLSLLSYLTFLFSGKVKVFVNLFIFFYFHFEIRRNGKIHLTACSFFIKWIVTLYFGKSCFVCIARTCPDTFFVSLLFCLSFFFCQYFLIYFFQTSNVSAVLFWSFHSNIFSRVVFFFFSTFACCWNVFLYVFLV